MLAEAQKWSLNTILPTFMSAGMLFGGCASSPPPAPVLPPPSPPTTAVKAISLGDKFVASENNLCRGLVYTREQHVLVTTTGTISTTSVIGTSTTAVAPHYDEACDRMRHIEMTVMEIFSRGEATDERAREMATVMLYAAALDEGFAAKIAYALEAQKRQDRVRGIKALMQKANQLFIRDLVRKYTEAAVADKPVIAESIVGLYEGRISQPGMSQAQVQVAIKTELEKADLTPDGLGLNANARRPVTCTSKRDAHGRVTGMACTPL